MVKPYDALLTYPMTDICYFDFIALSCRGSMERAKTKGKIKVKVKEKVMITVMVTMGKKVNKKEKSETSKPETT